MATRILAQLLMKTVPRGDDRRVCGSISTAFLYGIGQQLDALLPHVGTTDVEWTRPRPKE